MNGLNLRVVLVLAVAGLLFGLARRLLSRYVRARTARARVPPPTALTEKEHAAEIHIYRQPAYADRLRAYTILLDGKSAGELLDGATWSVIVPEGKHVVKLTIDWCESNPVTVDAQSGLPQRLTVSCNLRGWRGALALWYVAFARKSYLTLKYSEAAS